MSLDHPLRAALRSFLTGDFEPTNITFRDTMSNEGITFVDSWAQVRTEIARQTAEAEARV